MDDNGVLREIISRKEAKEKGLAEYFTGKICKRGHVSLRKTANAFCKECRKQDDKRRYQENKAELKKKYLDNIESRRTYAREYAKNNKVKRKEWEDNNKDKVRGYKLKYSRNNKGVYREYYKKNRDRIIGRATNWQKENRDAYNERFRARYEKDETFRVEKICRRLLKRVLDSAGKTKDRETFKALGYKPQDLFSSLENKFLQGMSWDNYGEWHIDHNYPVSRYLQDGVHDPAIINSLDNLLPMWAEDNHLKFNRTLEEFLEDFPDQAEKYKHFLEENYYE